MSFLDWASECAVMGGSELELRLDCIPRVKQGFLWRALGENPFALPDYQEIVSAVLGDSAENWGEKVFHLPEGCARFSVFPDAKDPLVHVSLRQIGHPIEEQSVLLPCILKPHGIFFVSGVRQSGRTSTVETLLKRRLAAGERAAVVSALPEIVGEGIVNLAPVDSLGELFRRLRIFEIVVLDLMLSPSVVEVALKLVEEGVFVFVTLSGKTIERGVEGFIEQFPLERRASARARWVDAMEGGVGQILVPGLEEDEVLRLSEVVVTEPKVKEAMAAKAWSQLYQLMEDSAEKTGMRTMNQALFRCLLKRSIDFRVAFQHSRDPNALDQLLHQVGF